MGLKIENKRKFMEFSKLQRVFSQEMASSSGTAMDTSYSSSISLGCSSDSEVENEETVCASYWPV